MLLRVNRCTSIFVCYFFSSVLSFAQNTSPIFDHLTTLNGLSSNKVNAILQDREGFYWVATTNGLNRYDGSRFKVYYANPNDSTTLSK